MPVARLVLPILLLLLALACGTETEAPTATPLPAYTPVPTETTEPTVTLRPTSTPEPTPTIQPTPTPVIEWPVPGLGSNGDSIVVLTANLLRNQGSIPGGNMILVGDSTGGVVEGTLTRDSGELYVTAPNAPSGLTRNVIVKWDRNIYRNVPQPGYYEFLVKDSRMKQYRTCSRRLGYSHECRNPGTIRLRVFEVTDIVAISDEKWGEYV